MSKEISDHQIFEQYKEDRSKGFSTLFEKYHQKIYYHIRRIVILHQDADDGLQNTFIKAWNNLDNFRKESSIYTWLFRIATNEALLLIKKRKKNTGLSLDDISDYFNSSEEGDKWFDGDEAERKFKNAIIRLPDKQRLVFNLKYFENMKYEEMSEVLETSVGALKASYHHAVKKIEEFIRAD